MLRKEIHINQLVDGFSTNAEGSILYQEIVRNLDTHGSISVSFRNVTPVSSSFLNSSFGSLIEELTFDQFKSKISIVSCSKSNRDTLMRYFKAFGRQPN